MLSFATLCSSRERELALRAKHNISAAKSYVHLTYFCYIAALQLTYPVRRGAENGEESWKFKFISDISSSSGSKFSKEMGITQAKEAMMHPAPESQTIEKRMEAAIEATTAFTRSSSTERDPDTLIGPSQQTQEVTASTNVEGNESEEIERWMVSTCIYHWRLCFSRSLVRSRTSFSWFWRLKYTLQCIDEHLFPFWYFVYLHISLPSSAYFVEANIPYTDPDMFIPAAQRCLDPQCIQARDWRYQRQKTSLRNNAIPECKVRRSTFSDSSLVLFAIDSLMNLPLNLPFKIANIHTGYWGNKCFTRHHWRTRKYNGWTNGGTSFCITLSPPYVSRRACYNAVFELQYLRTIRWYPPFLKFSKIGKVMRLIAAIPDDKAPPSDVTYQFRERAKGLIER